MKARIVATGEIVEVNPITVNKVLVFETPDMHLVGTEDIEFDENPFKNYIDWEQRRFELAMAAMQGILSNPSLYGESNWSMVESAVAMADAVIAKLKEE